MKKISYIIVTWNNAEIIEECIETLFQYAPNYENEVIVVDNDSKDDTCKVISEKFGEKVVLLPTGVNNGFSAANNIGLEHATGEYVFYVNPDVVFVEDIVTPMLEILDKKPEVGIVSPRLIYPDGRYQDSSANFPSISKLIWDDFQIYHFLPKEKRMKYAQAQYRECDDRVVDWTYGAAHLCRMSDVKEVGGYPIGYFMYGEDTEFCMSFLDKLNKKTYYLGQSKLIHLGGYSEKKVINSKKVVYVTRTNIEFVKRYHAKIYLHIYKVLLFLVSFIKSVIYSFLACISNKQSYENGKVKWKTSYQSVYKDDGINAENKLKK